MKKGEGFFMTWGKVYLVGAGPGDPKLITVRGLECIQEADVVIYDRLANPALLEHAKSGAELIYVGKLPKQHTLRQEEINELLVEKAKQGFTVTRLKGGDPAVFGRVGEEAARLNKAGVSFEVVPGVTAGIAAPMYAGIPVTHREHSSSFAMITGHLHKDNYEEEKWQAYAKGIDTLIFYMGVQNLTYICDQLIKHGKKETTPAALIEWGTMPKQRTVTGTLETLVSRATEESITHPAIIIVGDVVNLRETTKWFAEHERSILGTS